MILKQCDLLNLTFMGPCISNVFFFKYNQQDATLYNILYYCQCSTCFRRFLHPSSGSQKLFQLTHTSGSNKQAWHIPDAVCTVPTRPHQRQQQASLAHTRCCVCTVFELLMMGGETVCNMYSIDSKKEYCITLHLVGYT